MVKIIYKDEAMLKYTDITSCPKCGFKQSVIIDYDIIGVYGIPNRSLSTDNICCNCGYTMEVQGHQSYHGVKEVY